MELEDYITKAIDNIENDLIFRKKIYTRNLITLKRLTNITT